jgi:predicted ATP-grasp superfamily ATP-dependent carboligase
MQRLMQAAWALSIAQDDSTVTIADADGTRLILYTDNREVYYPMEDLGEVKTRARWKGEKLEVLRDVEDGPQITQTFELKEDGRQMRIRVKIEGGTMPSFSFRRVYDRKVEGN